MCVVMNVEEDLDHLIDQLMEGEKLIASGDETSAPLLAAAAMLVQLQEVALPPAFARQLEAFLRTRIRSLSKRQAQTDSLPWTRG